MIKTIFLAFLMMIFLTGQGMAQAPGSQAGAENGDDLPVIPSVDLENADAFADVCPEPKQALANTPNDLAQIQADITRFTLCVQRSQLLERLNNLTQQNIQTIDSALDMSMTPDLNNLAGDVMAAMPAPQMPVEPESDMMEQSSAPTPQPIQSDWRIRDISGKGGRLVAVLEDGNQTIARVSQGDSLPDSDARVTALSVRGVTISVNGETQNLQWRN